MKLLSRALAITTLIVAALTVPYLPEANHVTQTLLAYAAIVCAIAALYLLFRPEGILRSVSLGGGLSGIAVLVADAAMALAARELPVVLKLAAFALLTASVVSMLAYAGAAMTIEFKARVAAGRGR